MAHKAGGGMGSRVVKSSNAGRKVEPRSQGIRPGAVSQIGSALGNHAQDRRAEAVEPGDPRAHARATTLQSAQT